MASCGGQGLPACHAFSLFTPYILRLPVLPEGHEPAELVRLIRTLRPIVTPEEVPDQETRDT